MLASLEKEFENLDIGTNSKALKYCRQATINSSISDLKHYSTRTTLETITIDALEYAFTAPLYQVAYKETQRASEATRAEEKGSTFPFFKTLNSSKLLTINSFKRADDHFICPLVSCQRLINIRVAHWNIYL